MQSIADPFLKEMGPPQTFPIPPSNWALQGSEIDGPPSLTLWKTGFAPGARMGCNPSIHREAEY